LQELMQVPRIKIYHSKTSSVIDPSLVDSKTSTKNEDLSFVTKTLSVKNPSAINSKNKKKLSVIKNKTIIKPSSKTIKPYTQTRTCRKLADLAKEALTNSNELDATTSVPMNIQSE
ncbi:3260_t:CDS:1, partial [Gigaspora margarita]